MHIEAPLPSERVVPSAPFTITGIDFAGSVNIRCLKPRDTVYIALFTCATTRALHIEFLSDLTTDKFLLALQRFVGLRGLPNTIYTDNATTFHAANEELILLWQTLSSAKTQEYYAQNGITWRFIAPLVAWWGGWWERLIGIVKQCLRKVSHTSRVPIYLGPPLANKAVKKGRDECWPPPSLPPRPFFRGVRAISIAKRGATRFMMRFAQCSP
ncbi:integrase catalytic domain-containing protein [Nephila pilipes]|uniref:Integrase catalytic domain-containing protein n=1 Tax=Nephila pilipes TaxID=299642 RepID=A0A8X6TS82_NEPPI|nr:integrase catalytic domain-containing protein [Nephila pilipes]